MKLTKGCRTRKQRTLAGVEEEGDGARTGSARCQAARRRCRSRATATWFRSGSSREERACNENQGTDEEDRRSSPEKIDATVETCGGGRRSPRSPSYSRWLATEISTNVLRKERRLVWWLLLDDGELMNRLQCCAAR